jgi:hypothetical protein
LPDSLHTTQEELLAAPTWGVASGVPAAAGRIRSFRRGDISAVAALRQQAFRLSERRSSAALADYLETVFFRNPWVDPRVPSLVCQDEAGALVGFLGIIPRPMRFWGKPILAAVGTQLMVAPGWRGRLAGRRLARAFIQGPQDLSLSDTANDVARRLWESVGGATAVLYSFQWRVALRPARYATQRLAHRPLGRLAAFAARPLTTVIDALSIRGAYGRRWRTLPSQVRMDGLDAASLLEAFRDESRDFALRPTYEDGSVAWLLQLAAEKQQFGSLRGRLVQRSNGVPIGWFLYYARAGGGAHVMQVAARRGGESAVLNALYHDAWRAGAVSLTGRVEPRLVPHLADRGCRFFREGPWVLAHARRPEILNAVLRGDAFVSRLEGEGWLSF